MLNEFVQAFALVAVRLGVVWFAGVAAMLGICIWAIIAGGLRKASPKPVPPAQNGSKLMQSRHDEARVLRNRSERAEDW